jgi:hypothetical protein
VGQIPGLKAEVGDNFSYKVPATGLGLTFSDSSYLFDIAVDGTINFTPTPDMVGEHQAFISVSDALGNEEYIGMTIEVTA